MKHSIALAALCLVSIQAQAHDRWILPSHFNTSSDKGAVWITADTSASNQVFEYDKPFSADKVIIQTPEGKTDVPAAIFQGKRKAVFDYQLTVDGTYKFEYPVTESYFTRFKLKGEEQWQRKREDKATAKAQAPEGATDFTTRLSISRVESYVTLNKATDTVLKPSGKYLELTPLTHPADIAQNEMVKFKLTFNGKPIEGVEVDIIPEGTLYRNEIKNITVVSDQSGLVSFVPKYAGRYLLHTEHTQALKDNDKADELASSLFLTFAASLE
ncbi:DUF4198 domain-containing protein [Pseudoalteromonas tunicata]|uniref:ABC-type Co2+ transport system, periplasmic component n=1 Tax=Pseudoalteromonas tunicata D2 TaxID=87626 RepID=A4CER9_9GAMM|nr:DUF4198 domain-containing protein [Pseudoalteromonas tunicata]ATC96059.1 hypothetical protein PTUN_a3785 [Pseudoalteromonas tunicata]AXT31588.1 DUF4198 domain-containing protein [Pseudoalteromonas tunicata]EAR26798.1 hypothetical protein PTD2_16676 [Pseudoalteromonas tunicata D2]MDP4982636.1 DUF4198 domain-containing protein [Pseudoalteromonas tunicata]MDP5213281.1 DUF4198 domain-containing protein [Pseudoalteromonas tunicata]